MITTRGDIYRSTCSDGEYLRKLAGALNSAERDGVVTNDEGTDYVKISSCLATEIARRLANIAAEMPSG